MDQQQKQQSSADAVEHEVTDSNEDREPQRGDSDDIYIPQVQPQPKQRKLMLSKYTIYVTNLRMYIVGSNNRETMFRILEIDLTQPYNKELSIIEDNVFFTRNEIMKVLSGLEESSEGGLAKKLTAVGLLGFIRFTQNWYLVVITKKSVVSVLGGHYLYHIDDTELIPVCNNYRKPDRNSEETRYLTTFSSLDLSKTFYYSYTYDLTNTLQKNFLNNKKQSLGPHEHINFDYNEMFVWNSFLLKPILSASFDRIYDWFQPIIHGFIDQAKISIFDAKIYITIIARRSHHFAGARFLKRGVNDQGNVANEVETEQVVHDLLTSSFHDPTGGFYNNPRYTSYVQHRGSIPLSWSQEIGSNIKFQTKPPININVVDPFHSAAALHFDDLFKRYGSPVLVLNLIKQREKTPRESKLSQIFEECITYLNKFLTDKNKLSYTAWDMSRASKNRGQDVIEYLEHYADKTLSTTGFFHNGLNLKQTKLQQGVCRTNCIDCLDRTNAAQFIIGKRALGYQLQALGVVDDKYLEYDSDVVNILTEMFHDHGDTIALQYGGSHLVNTMETYRKINQWTSHSRDMIESIKRFYSNSFVDAQRQEAINLFLGNYVWEKGLPMLWDLNTDYYLHHDFIGANLKFKPSYTHWYTDSNLVDFNRAVIKYLQKTNPQELQNALILRKYNSYPNFYENYFIEMYIPRAYTSLDSIFEFNMNSTLRYADDQSASQNKEISSPGTKNNNDESETHNNKDDLTSPFETRKPQLINSKLKNLTISKELGTAPSSPQVDDSFDDSDEFNFLKEQVLQVFQNVENEYIYYPLNLKHFLTEQSTKILKKVVQDDGSLPVFDNSLNNAKNTNFKNGFYNFNLDGFQDSNSDFRNLSNIKSKLEESRRQLINYEKVLKIPEVELNDEIVYYNSLNSIRNLSINLKENYLTNEYVFDYHDSEVSAPDMQIYRKYYNYSNVGDGNVDKVDMEYIMNAKRDSLLSDEELKNDYFATRTSDTYGDDNEDEVISIRSLPSLDSVSPDQELSYSDSVLNNDYAINEGNISDVENRYDQFPNIQEDEEEEEEEEEKDGQNGINHIYTPKGEEPHLEENDDDDDDDDGFDDTVIHNEGNREPITFKTEDSEDLL